MYLVLSSLSLGLLTLNILPRLPSFSLLILTLVLSLLSLLLSLLISKQNIQKACLLIGIYGLAFSYTCYSAQLALDDRLERNLDSKTLWITGQVAAIPNQQNASTTFVLLNATSFKYRLPRKIRVSWYQAPPINTGDTLRLAVKIKHPHSILNPGGFDLEKSLTAQRIGATATVRIGEVLAKSSSISNVRDDLRTQLLNISPHGSKLAALVVGDNSGLSSDDWQLLKATGTVHLMVISGTHIGMLSLAIYGLLRCLMFLPFLRNFNLQKISYLIVSLAAVGYAFIAGFGVPVQRALIMLLIGIIWRMRYAHLAPLMVLLIAFNAILLFEPLASLQLGFWLSFGAVFCLIMIYQSKHIFINLTKTQLTISLGLIPLLVIFNLPVSLSAPIANLIAISWLAFIILPFALLGIVMPFIGDFFLHFANFNIDYLFKFLSLLADKIPAIMIPQVPWFIQTSSLLGGLTLLSPLPVRSLGLLLIAGLFFSDANKPKIGSADIWILDVGQGLSIIIRTQNHAVLYDAAANFNGFDRGEKIVFPALQALNIQKLDVMLLSHADNDHAGGALFISNNLPITKVISGEPNRLPTSLNAKSCEHDQSWQFDEVTFRVIYPQANLQGNAASCLLMVEANGERLLLTGDITSYVEHTLIAQNIDIATNWLLAPHHGSRTSSNLNFLQASKAHNILISRGIHNNFGHPHPEIIQRYQKLNMRIFDTAKTGAQNIKLGSYKDLSYMKQPNRFWRTNQQQQ